MSKARQLANLLSADRDLADGSVAGGEFNFTAYGDIVKNKPVILRSDGTVQQAGQTNTIAAYITSRSIDSVSDSSYPYDYVTTHDMVEKDGLLYLLHSKSYDNANFYTLLSILKLDQNNEFTVLLDRASVSSNANLGYKQGFLNILPDGAIMVTMIRADTTSSSYRSKRYTHIYTFDENTSTLTLQNTNDDYYDFYNGDYTSNLMYAGDDTSYWYYVFAVDYSTYVAYRLLKIAKSNYNISNSDLENESEYGSGWGFVSTLANHSWKMVEYPVSGSDYFQLLVQYGGNIGKGLLYRSGVSVYDSTVNTITDLNNTYSPSTTTSGTYFDILYDESRDKYIFAHRTNTDDFEVCLLSNTITTKVRSVTIPGFVLGGFVNQKLIAKDSNGKIVVLAVNSSSSFSYTKRNGQIVSGYGLYLITIAEDTAKGRLYVEDIIVVRTFDTSGTNHIVVDENTNIAYTNYRAAFYGSTLSSSSGVRAYSTGDPFATNVVEDPLNIIGFAKNDAVDGSEVTVAMDGGLVTLPNLTVNNNYYVDTGGFITSNTSDSIAGKAISSSTLKIDFKGMDQLSASELDVLDNVTAGTVSGDKALVADSLGDITFPDSDKIKFGTDGDTQIYHNGTNFYLDNTTGFTYILSDSETVIQGSKITLETNTGENALHYDGAYLYGYYNGTAKFNTHPSGLNVTGTLYSSGLSVGGTSTISGAVNITGDVNVTGEVLADSYNETYAAVTSTTNATTVDCEAGNSFSHTLTENTTFTFSNPPASGTAYSMSIEIIQDASASGFTVTWPTSVDWPSATAPTLTATASAVDVFVFTTRDGGTTWYGFTAGQALG